MRVRTKDVLGGIRYFPNRHPLMFFSALQPGQDGYQSNDLHDRHCADKGIGQFSLIGLLPFWLAWG